MRSNLILFVLVLEKRKSVEEVLRYAFEDDMKKGTKAVSIALLLKELSRLI